MMLNDLCAYLLPPDDHLHFETLIMHEQRFMLVVTMTAPKAMCPDCSELATRIHSWYPRVLADLPWATTPIELRLHVRRFFCPTPGCKRKTFTERLPAVAPLYARTTARLADHQTYTGLALGGVAGARQLARQGIPGSHDTVLRRVRRLPTPQGPPPQVVGIDDWAWRKGHRYGTIVVDLERGCPIDVLEDRLADTVAAWFQDHPEVTIVARDRAEAYAAGIRQGAPEATQVADRFHLFQNVSAALEEVFRSHDPELQAINDTRSREPRRLEDGTVAVPVPPPQPAPKTQIKAEQSRTRRLARYKHVWDLHHKGWPAQAIATDVGMSRQSVFRYLRSSTFPERQPRRPLRAGVLDPFKAYVVERWNAGCRNATKLFEEIKAQGFQGQYGTVAQYVTRMRTAQGIPSKSRPARGAAKVAEPTESPLTPRSAACLVLQREENRDEAAAQRLAQLHAQHGELALAIDLAQDFAQLVRLRQPEHLDDWLARAAQSALKAFERFATGLREDYEAVKAGVTLPWSTGPVEGQINRLKMLKRQMFGRANIDLLRQRVLYAT